MSHVEFRVPQISTRLGLVEVINNVVYHTTSQAMNVNCAAHTEAGQTPGPSKTRFIKNYQLRVPTNAGSATGNSEINMPPGCEAGAQIHAKGNIGPVRTNDSLPDNLSIEPAERSRWTADPTLGGAFPWPAIRVTEDSAQVALERTSGTGAFAGTHSIGATKPKRDTVDTRIVAQLTRYMANPSDPNTVPVPGGPNGGLLDNPNQVGGFRRYRLVRLPWMKTTTV